MKPGLVDGQQNGVHSSTNGGERKLLNNPVMLSDAASFMRDNDGEAPAASIWNKPKGEEMVGGLDHIFINLWLNEIILD